MVKYINTKKSHYKLEAEKTDYKCWKTAELIFYDQYASEKHLNQTMIALKIDDSTYKIPLSRFSLETPNNITLRTVNTNNSLPCDYDKLQEINIHFDEFIDNFADLLPKTRIRTLDFIKKYNTEIVPELDIDFFKGKYKTFIKSWNYFSDLHLNECITWEKRLKILDVKEMGLVNVEYLKPLFKILSFGPKKFTKLVSNNQEELNQ